jgi:hypothetical protein
MRQRLPRFDNRLATAVLLAGPPLALAAFLLFVGKAIALGFRKLFGDRDHEKLKVETPISDALFAWCQDDAAPGRRNFS